MLVLQVEPVKDFPQPAINKASADLIAEFNRERFHQDTESERQLGQVRRESEKEREGREEILQGRNTDRIRRKERENNRHITLFIQYFNFLKHSLCLCGKECQVTPTRFYVFRKIRFIRDEKETKYFFS